jgi:octaprenyl-diphosphate synthase
MTGKPGGLDLREHKVTLPLIATLGRASAAERLRIDALFAMESPDDELIAEVIEIVTRNGGIEYARGRGAAFANDAERALHVLPEGPVRASLTDAIAYVMDRRS